MRPEAVRRSYASLCMELATQIERRMHRLNQLHTEVAPHSILEHNKHEALQQSADRTRGAAWNASLATKEELERQQ